MFPLYISTFYLETAEVALKSIGFLVLHLKFFSFYSDFIIETEDILM